VFALQPFAAGQLLAVFGGKVVSAEGLHRLRGRRRLALQVDDELYLVSQVEGPCDWVNHSCDPSAGMSGQVCLVARRALRPGDEVCYDYCMTDGSDYDEFECACGAATCRRVIRGTDWTRAELQQTYEGYFSPYLEARIRKQRRLLPAPRSPLRIEPPSLRLRGPSLKRRR
jgi:hypothetical protein